jgi:hypothetical protein
MERDERERLLSAYLDGDASAAERATIEASPDLVAEAAAWTAARAALRDAHAGVDVATRDAAIGAALDHLGDRDDPRSVTPAGATDLAARRERRRRQSRWLGAAAAAAAVVVAGGALIANGRGESRDDSAARDASIFASSSAGSPQLAAATHPPMAADGGNDDVPIANDPAELNAVIAAAKRVAAPTAGSASPSGIPSTSVATAAGEGDTLTTLAATTELQQCGVAQATGPDATGPAVRVVYQGLDAFAVPFADHVDLYDVTNCELAERVELD